MTCTCCMFMIHLPCASWCPTALLSQGYYNIEVIWLCKWSVDVLGACTCGTYMRMYMCTTGPHPKLHTATSNAFDTGVHLTPQSDAFGQAFELAELQQRVTPLTYVPCIATRAADMGRLAKP